MDPLYHAPPELSPLPRGLLDTTHERHWDMTQLVSGLPDEALDWLPAPFSASLAGLVLHIVDVETHVARLALGEPEPDWTGGNGSRMTESVDYEGLRTAIDGADELLKGALSRITDARLAVRSSEDAQSIGEAVVGDLDHVAMHHGQLQLTRHLWEAEHPEWPSLYQHWR